MDTINVFIIALAILITMMATHEANAGQYYDQKSSKNLIPNPSFEIAKGNKPEGWDTQSWNGKPEFHYAEIGRTGNRSVMISSDEGADAAWFIILPVEPYSTYKLSAWVKTEDVKVIDGGELTGATIVLHDHADIHTPRLLGTNDWTKVEREFQTGDMDAIQINLMLGLFGLAKGKVWYDDVSLELISKTELKPTLAIDANKEGEPISKYVYGQFIEHLGRCIYGGIWAEMLQDRKFFYDVGRGESPWKPIGGNDVVRMVKQNPYVGEHTPEIEVKNGTPSGISHSGLGLIKGKEYTGRIVLAGEKNAGPIEVSLVWGTDPKSRQTVTIEKLTGEFTKYPLKFKSDATTDDGRLEIVGRGEGTFKIGAVSLMPADNISGFRADTIKILKELNSPVYRWPGGNFVSGYNWKDGIGDPDRRPPRKNPAWSGIEHNDVGLHEFLEFCRILKTDPYIAVNTGLGTPEEAAEEVEYVNGAPDTPMGRLRAQNGHREPYNVKWWGVGNEMYGGWQLGHMPITEYVKKHNAVAKAMWEKDPSIKLIASGTVGEWDEMMFKHCADYMNLMSEHFYCGERPGVIEHVKLVPNAIKGICNAYRDYRKNIPTLKNKDIRIAMDEWNYWYGPHLYGELGTRYFLKDALGIAAGLHEYYRNSDLIFMANYAQTVNVIGAIKTTKTAAEFETTGLVLKLYRQNYGTIPVQVTSDCRPLDATAAWSADRKKLTIAIVNPTKEAFDLPLKITGAKLKGSGRCFVITGKDEMAYNEPGKPRNVDIAENAVKISDKLHAVPLSVTLYSLDVQ